MCVRAPFTTPANPPANPPATAIFNNPFTTFNNPFTCPHEEGQEPNMRTPQSMDTTKAWIHQNTDSL